ncbi:MAG: hypothetical protein HY287_17750 [Planctomycetes bacterium]|nr:hypothetical protein [Planctomycetota bacterium]MBI3836168.1 hypothetical protein [Planctomycetota bacterium]
MAQGLKFFCAILVGGLATASAFGQTMTVTPDVTTEFSFGGFEGGPFVAGTSTVWTLDDSDLAALDFTAISDQAWLLLAPTASHLPGSLVVDRTRDVNAVVDSVEAAKLAPGVYTANVSFTNITNGVGSTTRSVKLSVAAANFSITPGFVSVLAVQNGPSPTPITILLQSNGQSDLNYTVDWTSKPWLVVNKTGGTVHGGSFDSVVLTFNTLGLAAGTYTSTITITNTTNGVGTRQVPVTLVVQQGGTGSVVIGPDADLEVLGAAGKIPKNLQQSTLVNNSDAVVVWTASANEDWVSVTPSGGQLAATNHTTGGLDEQVVTIRVNSAVDDLGPGSHTATVTFQNVTASGGIGGGSATNIGTRIVHVVADPVLHVSVPLSGGSVTASPPAQVVAGGSSGDLVVPFGDVVTVSVNVEDGFVFSGWGADFHLDNLLENPLVLTMDKNRTVSAVIVPIDQKLTLSTSGSGTGIVKVTPSGSSVDNDLVSSYARGAQVKITAVADDGSAFRGWAGNVPQGEDQTNPLTVMMDSDRTITARFDALVDLIIQVTSGGTVTTDTNQTSFAPGTSVTLTATPADGFVFTGWGGAGSGSDTTLTLTLTSSETVTATFAPSTDGGTSPRLVVDVQGNGTVTPDGGTFATGQMVTLIATPSITSTFVRWDGDATGTDLVTTVVMDGNRQVQAVFTAADSGGTGSPGTRTPTACGAMGAIGLSATLLGLASMMMFRGRRGF